MTRVNCRASSPLRRIVWLVRLYALLLIVLHLIAGALPENQTWGLFPYTYLPRWLQWLLAAVGAALCIGQVNARVRWLLGWLADRWPLKERRSLWFALLSLASALPFWLGRIVHTRWGDAYILVNAIPHPEVRLTYTWQAPLDLLVHAKAWALTNRLWGWDAMRVYHVISVATGVVFVFTLLCMANDLGRDRVEKAAFAGLIGTLGLIQFYFGYIENYVLMTVGILAYLWLGLRHVRGEMGVAWPASALAITNALHPSTILGLEWSLAWLWLSNWLRFPSRNSRLQATLKVVLPLLAALAGVILIMELGGHGISALMGSDSPGGGDRRWFVPLSVTSTKWERYTMFSLGHLLDIANEHLLVAPFSAMLAVALLLTRRGRAALRTPAGLFLAVAAGGYLLLTFLWNPDYGGRRDWDLFAPAALPLTLFAVYLLVEVARSERHGSASSQSDGSGECGQRDSHSFSEIVLVVAGVSLIFALSWVYSNTIPWYWGQGK